MKSLESLSLKEMQGLKAIRPDLAVIAARLLVSSYVEFVEVLYNDIDLCIKHIENDPKIRQNDAEDRLTADIIGMLAAANYDVSHDETIGGHSDIVVKHQLGYLWVGEAKIHTSYEKLNDGFNQLTTRYLRGTPNADQGGLIIYIFNSNVANVVKTWAKRLDEMRLPCYASKPCDKRKELAFYTDQKHASSGLMVKIRHLGVNLHWNPKV